MDAGAAVELPTAAAELCMFFTMIKPTDGAWLHTDRADGRTLGVGLGKVACGKMLVAKLVFAAFLCREMVGAKSGMAEVAMAHALLAAFLATLRTSDGIGGKLSTAGTFIQTFQTIGIAAGIALEEAGADLPPTFATCDQAVGAEALTRSGTDAKLGTVLLATWATSGTISTNERM
jgi:hypothetical protein